MWYKKLIEPILTMKYGAKNKIKPHIIKTHPILSKINPILTDPILTEKSDKYPILQTPYYAF
jgi:hypothetical protein